MRKNTLATALPAAVASLALVLGLSACGQSQAGEPEESSASQVAAAPLGLDDAWVKSADEGMTGVFGTLENTTDADINLVEAKYDGAEAVQLHETSDDGTGQLTMQEKEGGFVIPAGGTLALEPGGDHIMVMGLTRPIQPGEEITVDLVTADGQTVPVTAVAKEYSGAQETYAPGEAEGSSTGSEADENDMGDMAGMDHGEGEMADMGGKSGDH